MGQFKSFPVRLGLGGHGPWPCRKNSAVPPGLESCCPLYPALPRWAKLVRPCGDRFLTSHSAALGGSEFSRTLWDPCPDTNDPAAGSARTSYCLPKILRTIQNGATSTCPGLVRKAG